jgi:hypothetical protein
MGGGLTALRELALQVALAELGKGETAGNNRGPDVDRFRAGGRAGRVGSAQSWCASFVSFCYRRAAAKLGVTLPFKTSGGAKRLTKNIIAAGAYLEPSPWQLAASRGAVICWHRGLGAFDWRGHVGIIERYEAESDALHTIEGNRGPLVAQYRYAGWEWRRRLYRIAAV